jgi:hypothetical protein
VLISDCITINEQKYNVNPTVKFFPTYGIRFVFSRMCAQVRKIIIIIIYFLNLNAFTENKLITNQKEKKRKIYWKKCIKIETNLEIKTIATIKLYKNSKI